MAVNGRIIVVSDLKFSRPPFTWLAASRLVAEDSQVLNPSN